MNLYPERSRRTISLPYLPKFLVSTGYTCSLLLFISLHGSQQNLKHALPTMTSEFSVLRLTQPPQLVLLSLHEYSGIDNGYHHNYHVNIRHQSPGYYHSISFWLYFYELVRIKPPSRPLSMLQLLKSVDSDPYTMPIMDSDYDPASVPI